MVDPADLDVVARQLGREPRGVLDIAYRCPNGEPGVVKTAPKLPDGTPFPTLYYLTHPALTAAASRLETTGMMRDMTQRLQCDPELAAAYRRAHKSYLDERDAIEPAANLTNSRSLGVIQHETATTRISSLDKQLNSRKVECLRSGEFNSIRRTTQGQ